jgi:hypothetical protein
MDLFIKIRKLLSLDLKTMFLLLEAYFYLGWARLFLLKSFVKVAPNLGNPMEETQINNENTSIMILNNISDSIEIMSRHTFWQSKCFVKAIAAMKMLERRKIESTLYLGTAKDKDGKMIAHAWLRSGTFYVSGKEGMNRFTIVNYFAKKIDRSSKIEGYK